MSKKFKLSPWHDGSVKPKHIGIYELYYPKIDDTGLSFWDGHTFHGGWNDVYKAYENRIYGTDQIAKFTLWRGILK